MTNLEAFKEKELVLEVDEKFKEYKFIQDLIAKCVPILNEKYVEYVKQNPECKFLTVDNFSAFYHDPKFECKIVLTTDSNGKNTMKAQDFIKEYYDQFDDLYDFMHDQLALEVDEDTEPIDTLQEFLEQNIEIHERYKAGNKSCIRELAKRAINSYGIGNACISFELGMFGWCSKKWYIDNNYRVMHIRDFVAQCHEPDSNAEDEWEKLYKEYTGENDE